MQFHTKSGPNFLNCTDLNKCGARRDAELCRLCYKDIKSDKLFRV